MHEPEGLAHAVLDRKARPGPLRPRLEDLEAQNLVERARYVIRRFASSIRSFPSAYSSPFVATFDQLSEEQRAVVELVLRRGKDYEELSEMLGMPEARVRELARDALLELAPLSARGVEEDWRGQLADYVLGQQSGPEATATRGHLRRSEAARTWARSLMDSLEQLYDNGSMPAIPEGERAGRTRKAEEGSGSPRLAGVDVDQAAAPAGSRRRPRPGRADRGAAVADRRAHRRRRRRRQLLQRLHHARRQRQSCRRRRDPRPGETSGRFRSRPPASSPARASSPTSSGSTTTRATPSRSEPRSPTRRAAWGPSGPCPTASRSTATSTCHASRSAATPATRAIPSCAAPCRRSAT